MSDNAEVSPPPTPTAPPPLPGKTPLSNRSTLLIAAGILQLLLGGGCVLLVLMSLVLLSPAVQRVMEQAGQAPSRMNMGAAIFIYSLLATLLIWTGIGAIRCRRWAVPVMQCIAWGGLVAGVLAVIGVGLMFPAIIDATQTQMQQQMERQSRMTHSPMPPAEFQEMMRVMIGVTVVFSTLIYVVIPGFFVWVYTRKSVRECCEKLDTQRRWTDSVPTPAIGLGLFALMLSMGGVMMVFAGAVPMFTKLLTGLPAGAVGGGVIFAGLFAAKSAIDRRPIGWWLTLILMLVMQGSYLVYFATQDISEYNQALGLSEQQLEMVNRMYETHPLLLWPMIGMWLAAGLVFLIWVKRYVKAGSGDGDQLR